MAQRRFREKKCSSDVFARLCSMNYAKNVGSPQFGARSVRCPPATQPARPCLGRAHTKQWALSLSNAVVPGDSTCTAAQQHHSCFRHWLTAGWVTATRQPGRKASGRAGRRWVPRQTKNERDNGSERALLKEKPMAVERPNLLSCISSGALSHAMQLSAPLALGKFDRYCHFLPQQVDW